MITAGVVAAEACVRSRDGRSVLDDARGTGPAKAFTADPDRLHAAVLALEGHGLVVDAVDRVAVTFHGPPEAFAEAFEVQLAHVDDGAGQLVWQVDGSRGTLTFDVAAGAPLGGVVHAGVLRLLTAPADRPITTSELFVGTGNPVPRDFLLGEVGQSLRGALPEAVRTRRRFPATTRDSALIESVDSLSGWREDPLRVGIHDLITSQKVMKRQPVSAVIIEPSASRVDLGWSALTGDDRSTPLPRLVGPLPRIYEQFFLIPLTPPEKKKRAEVFFTTAMPVWRLVRHRMTATLPAEVDDQALVELQDRWPAFATGVSALCYRIIAVKKEAFLGDDVIDGDDDVGLLLQRLRDMPAALRAADRADLATRLHEIKTQLDQVREWFATQVRRYEPLFAQYVEATDVHATMVSYAFLAVALDDVDLTLRRAADQSIPFWKGERLRASRTVFSGSFGTQVAEDISNESLMRCWRLAAARLRQATTLQVIAVGNNNVRGDRRRPDAPSLDAVLVPDVANVLVVGGCTPTDGGWEATDATHGYTFDLPGGPTVQVPHVCATTKSDTGGCVVFPDQSSPLRWWTGAGSSLATPIAAAVCALIWNAYPGLTAAQVKAAMLAAAKRHPLDGAFHRPTVGRRGVNPLPEPHGIGRVVLQEALAQAEALSTTGLTRPHPLVGAATTGGGFS